MSARDFPPECPVFRIIGDGEHAPDGAIVEAFAPNDDPLVSRSKIGVRLVDESASTCTDAHYRERCVAVLGFVGFAARIDVLTPLTPAAREWLAYAKERAA